MLEAQAGGIRVGAQVIMPHRERTADAYRTIAQAWSDECTCVPCRNFAAQRGHTFPPSLSVLMDWLGIDSRKDSEVYGCYPMPSGKRQYSGWFFFCGILAQDGTGVENVEGVSYYVRGPGNMPAPGTVFEPNPLALEFTIELPWVLAGENPDELYGPAIAMKQ